MNMCYEYSIKWRYEFNHLKSGIVIFGETKRVHSEPMKVRNWTLGSESGQGRILAPFMYNSKSTLMNY